MIKAIPESGPGECVRCAIRETLARYNMAGDSARYQDMAATFTEDGVLETVEYEVKGRADIVRRMGMVSGRIDARLSVVRHNLTTSIIDLESETAARARSYFLVTTDIGPDHMGVYTDRLEKVDGLWLIAHRKVRLDWVHESSLFGMPPKGVGVGFQPASDRFSG